MDFNPIRSLMPLTPLTPLQPLSTEGVTQVAGASPSGSFQNILNEMLGSQVEATAKADKAIEALATGQAEDLHTVSLAVAQADLTFRMLLEVRNRLTEAYQEVTRMQV